MFNIIPLLDNLRRPKILVRAARLGLSEYNRDTDLLRVAQIRKTASSNAIIDRLLAQEGNLEVARKSGDASYSIQRHIRVLTAVLAEAKLVIKSQQRTV